jgi:hypothetical protein
MDVAYDPSRVKNCNSDHVLCDILLPLILLTLI